MALRRRGFAMKKDKPSRPTRLLLRRMFGYLGYFKKIVLIGAILSIFSTVFSAYSPLFISAGIDKVLSVSATLNGLLFLIIIYIVFKVVAWLLYGAYTWVMSIAQAGFVQKIQADIYDHLLRADLSYHKREQSGNVTSRVTSDTVSLATGIQVIIDFTSQLLLLAATFYILWSTSPLVALTSLVVVPGVILLAAIFGTVGQRIMLKSRRAYGEVSGQIAENLNGIHIAKAFNREKDLAKKMLELNNKAYKFGLRFMILISSTQPLMRTVGMFGIAALLFIGGSLAAGTYPILTIGEVFLGTILIKQFMMPLISLAMFGSQVQQSLAAMDRVSDVLEAKPAIRDKPNAVPLKESSDGIKFDHVTFWYVEGTPVLKDVTFDVKPGETVALVGHTGAGKTTIAALINRFYDPQKGNIYIGDQNIRDVTLKSLHESISLISQEPYLFDGTIMDNIRYGKLDATDEEVYAICREIGADEFIEVLPDGYNTVVKENGKNLSAGQRQMITIARTMLANPKILILDEATSRLDAYSEALVQAAQARLFANRTTIVIAHRLTTIANASRIFVFDHGKLIEQGTHEELLALGGTYKMLYDIYYAHQGIEELTEEKIKEVDKEIPEEPKRPATGMMAGMMPGMMGMKNVPENVRRKMREKMMKSGEIPEEVRKMMEQGMGPDSEIPEEVRKKMRKKMHEGAFP